MQHFYSSLLSATSTRKNQNTMRNSYTNTTGNSMPANVALTTPDSNYSTGSGWRKAVSFVVAAFFVWALLIGAGVQTGFAQSAGFNSSYAVFSINGGGDTYYCMPSNTSCGANPSLSGANLGNFSGANTLVLKGAEHNVYKCGGADITSTTLNYRIYKTGTTPGSFTQSNIGFSSGGANGCGGQDQQWKDISLGINVLSGLTPANYTIEIFSEEATTLGTQFLNNSGSNYKATFNYCGSLSGALPVGNYAIPGCFATIAAAVNYINTNGVTGTGDVQFDIAAGYTETAPVSGYNITATGTSTLGIKFVKMAGAASTITAGLQVAAGTAALASFDAIFKITGGDYITIDGLTLQENAGNN